MRVIWSRAAVADKDAIWLFLADRDLAYADKVEARLDSRAALLSQFPRLGRPVPDSDLRELSIPDTQHVIVYRIDGDIASIESMVT